MAELFPLFSLFFYFWRWRVSTEGSCRGPPNSHLFLFLTFPAPHLERRKRKWWQTGYVMYKFPSRRQLAAVATWIYDGILFFFSSLLQLTISTSDLLNYRSINFLLACGGVGRVRSSRPIFVHHGHHSPYRRAASSLSPPFHHHRSPATFCNFLFMLPT